VVDFHVADRLRGSRLAVKDLVGAVIRGEIRVPRFDNDFRWNRRDVIRLLDSVTKGYPIGDLLLWARPSPAERAVIGRLAIELPTADRAWWVVDGQQRVTSLVNALHPEANGHAPFDVSYDLDVHSFVPRPPSEFYRYVPASLFLDSASLYKWFELAATSRDPSYAEYLEEAFALANGIQRYPVSTYQIEHEDADAAVEIFARTNSRSKSLGMAAIFSAAPLADYLGGNVSPVRAMIGRVAARTGFGVLDEGTATAAMPAAHRAGADSGPSVGASDGPDDRYRAAENALVRAAEFLQERADVPHVALLPHRPVLTILAQVFAAFPSPVERNLELLRRLFWRTTTLAATSPGGDVANVVRSLTDQIMAGNESRSVSDMLLTVGEPTAADPFPRTDHFAVNALAGKIVLSSWWSLRPRSPLTGQPYDEHDVQEALADQSTATVAIRPIFGRDIPDDQRHWAANWLFVPSATDPIDDFLVLFGRQPATLSDTEWERVLASYCITPASAVLLRTGRKEEFLAARRETTDGNLSDFLHRMARWGHDDSPPLDWLMDDDLNSPDGVPE
jgi:hypothetical protein